MSFNPITKAVADIRRVIPKEIINQVFQPKYSAWATTASSVEDEIVRRVIRPQVLVDCNLIGGKEVTVRTEQVRRVQTPEQYTVLYIQKELTQGRSIVQPMHLSFVNYPTAENTAAANFYKPCSVTPLTQAVAALAGSNNTSVAPGTSRLELVGENVVLVKEPGMFFAYGLLRCMVENDTNMNNLHARNYFAFTELCKHAVKAFIYNELVIELDMGKIQGGFEIGRFRDIVDGYSEAANDYIEYRDRTWIKVAQMNDPETYNRYIRSMLGGFR